MTSRGVSSRSPYRPSRELTRLVNGRKGEKERAEPHKEFCHQRRPLVEFIGTVIQHCSNRRDADRWGRAIVQKLRSEIDRHLFEVALQAAIGTKNIARETISALRKNVTGKCYGGHISHKKKLWAKQKEGKNRMKSIGSVDIPRRAYMAVLDTGSERQ